MVHDHIKFLVSRNVSRHNLTDIVANAGLLDKAGRPIGFIKPGDDIRTNLDKQPYAAVIEQFEILALAILAERSGVAVDDTIAKATDKLLELATDRVIPDAESSIRKTIDTMLGNALRR